MVTTLAILKIIAPVIQSAFAATTAYFTYKNIKSTNKLKAEKIKAEKQED